MSRRLYPIAVERTQYLGKIVDGWWMTSDKVRRDQLVAIGLESGGRLPFDVLKSEAQILALITPGSRKPSVVKFFVMNSNLSVDSEDVLDAVLRPAEGVGFVLVSRPTLFLPNTPPPAMFIELEPKIREMVDAAIGQEADAWFMVVSTALEGELARHRGFNERAFVAAWTEILHIAAYLRTKQPEMVDWFLEMARHVINLEAQSVGLKPTGMARGMSGLGDLDGDAKDKVVPAAFLEMGRTLAIASLDFIQNGVDARRLWIWGWRELRMSTTFKKNGKARNKVASHPSTKKPPKAGRWELVNARGPSGIGTAIYAGCDPWAMAVCLAFGQFGQLWPKVVPNMLKEVKKLVDINSAKHGKGKGWKLWEAPSNSKPKKKPAKAR